MLSVAFSADGDYIASCSKDSTIKIWEVKSGKLVHNFKHAGQMSCLTYFGHGRYLAACSYNGSITIIDTATFEVIYTVAAHAEWVISVVSSPDGKYLASGSGDMTAKVWRLDVK